MSDNIVVPILVQEINRNLADGGLFLFCYINNKCDYRYQ